MQRVSANNSSDRGTSALITPAVTLAKIIRALKGTHGSARWLFRSWDVSKDRRRRRRHCSRTALPLSVLGVEKPIKRRRREVGEKGRGRRRQLSLPVIVQTENDWSETQTHKHVFIFCSHFSKIPTYYKFILILILILPRTSIWSLFVSKHILQNVPWTERVPKNWVCVPTSVDIHTWCKHTQTDVWDTLSSCHLVWIDTITEKLRFYWVCEHGAARRFPHLSSLCGLHNTPPAGVALSVRFTGAGANM